MRALVCKEFGSTDDLVVEELDDPVPAPGQVLVDIHAAGINFPDILVIAGQYQLKTPPPFIPGNEAAGVVSGIGDGVSRFAVGDKVIVMLRGGAFAEKCAVDENLVFPLPDQLSFEQGAGFSVTYCTSYHALKQSANLKPGETLLVLGAAGGVGTTAIEIGKAMGARVIAAASSDEKLEFAKSVGADEIINYTETSLNDAVKELTGGAGADVVYDPGRWRTCATGTSRHRLARPISCHWICEWRNSAVSGQSRVTERGQHYRRLVGNMVSEKSAGTNEECSGNGSDDCRRPTQPQSNINLFA